VFAVRLPAPALPTRKNDPTDKPEVVYVFEALSVVKACHVAEGVMKIVEPQLAHKLSDCAGAEVPADRLDCVVNDTGLLPNNVVVPTAMRTL
jgi:hypothetical protein